MATQSQGYNNTASYTDYDYSYVYQDKVGFPTGRTDRDGSQPVRVVSVGGGYSSTTSYWRIVYAGVETGGPYTFSSSGSTMQVRQYNSGTARMYFGRNTNASGYVYDPGDGQPYQAGALSYSMNYQVVANAPASASASRSVRNVTVTCTAPTANNATPNEFGDGTISDYKVQYRSASSAAGLSSAAWGNEQTMSSRSYTYTSLTGNTYYEFRTYAVNEVGNSAATLTSQIYVPTTPSAPTGVTASANNTDSQKIDISWTAPSNGGATITQYDVYRDGVSGVGTLISSVTGNPAATSTTDTTATIGTSHTYYVYAYNEIGWGPVSTSSGSVTVPGAPSAPTFGSNPPSKVGRNVTVSVTANANAYGKTISGYYVQYQYASTSGGTYSAWSTPVAMTLSGGNYSYTYSLMTPALWYKFRVYAYNSIINNSSGTRTYYPHNNLTYTANFSPSSTGTTAIFVSSGGKRYTGTTWQPTEIAKRYNGSSWVDITIAKRFDGTNWVDLT